jgi:hypothetical protein
MSSLLISISLAAQAADVPPGGYRLKEFDLCRRQASRNQRQEIQLTTRGAPPDRNGEPRHNENSHQLRPGLGVQLFYNA